MFEIYSYDLIKQNLSQNGKNKIELKLISLWCVGKAFNEQTPRESLCLLQFSFAPVFHLDLVIHALNLARRATIPVGAKTAKL